MMPSKSIDRLASYESRKNYLGNPPESVHLWIGIINLSPKPSRPTLPAESRVSVAKPVKSLNMRKPTDVELQGPSLFVPSRRACVRVLFHYHRGMPYVPPIPKSHLETYRAAARAYRAARRLGARQHEWHWAAVREVIKRHPEMTHREADSFAQSIIRYVSLYYGKWFWN